MRKRTPSKDRELRLYLLNGLGHVVGSGDRPGVFDELTLVNFDISTFTDAESPHDYLYDCLLQGQTIEVDQIPGFTAALSAEHWHNYGAPGVAAARLFRPLDWQSNLLCRGLGCTHAKSSAERQRLQQGGKGEAKKDFSPENLPNPAEYPYEFVRYYKRPETFDSCVAIEEGAMIGAGGAICLHPNTLMVVETEICYFVAHRRDRRKPPRMLGYTGSNDVTGHSIEALNPLYLPQAKCSIGSISLGPCMVVPRNPLELTWENCKPTATTRFIPDSTTISLKLIAPDGTVKVSGTSKAGDTFRPIQYYMPWAIRRRNFPMFWIQSGTGIMHPKGVGVEEGDTIIISMDQVGDLITGAKLMPKDFLDEWESSAEIG